MEANAYYRYRVGKIGRYFSRILKDFVSGIPDDGDHVKTSLIGKRPLGRVHARGERGASEYHPAARPEFKKMTLSREKKKEKLH